MYKKSIVLNLFSVSFLFFSACVIPSQGKKELNEAKPPTNNINVVKPSIGSNIPNVNDNKVDNSQKNEDKPSLDPIVIPSIETSAKPILDNTLTPSVVPKDLSSKSSQNSTSTSLNSTTAFLYLDVNTSKPKNENEGTISLTINSERPKSE